MIYYAVVENMTKSRALRKVLYPKRESLEVRNEGGCSLKHRNEQSPSNTCVYLAFERRAFHVNLKFSLRAEGKRPNSTTGVFRIYKYYLSGGNYFSAMK